MKTTVPARKRPSVLTHSIAALLALAALPTVAKAAIFTYDDGGAGFNWSEAANWNPNAAPVNGSDLVFSVHTAGAGSRLSTNDSLTNVASLSFGGQIFLLNGNPITLGAGGITKTSAGTQTLSFTGTGITLGAAQTWNAAAGTLNVTSPVALNGQTLTVAGAQNTTLSGTVSGAGGLIKNDAGNLTVSNPVTFSTGVALNAGTLTATGGLNVTGGALTGGGTLNGSLNYTSAAGVNSQFDGQITGAATTVTVNNLGASNILQLTAANNYGGLTTVTGGLLQISNATGLGGTAQGTVVQAGGALSLFNVAVGAEALTINGAGNANFGSTSGAALIANASNSSYAGAITVASNATIGVAGGAALTLSGGIAKNGTALTLTTTAGAVGRIIVNTNGISGAAPNSDLIVDHVTVDLDVANTYNGPTIIRSNVTAGTGILNAGVANALPTANGRSAIIMDDAGLGGSQLNINGTLANPGGTNQAVASLTSPAATSTVTLGANTLTIGTAAGTTTFAGVIQGPLGGIIKDGASTQVLAGNNTYVGTTVVQGGHLQIGDGVSGNLNGASAVTVNPGANLDLNLANNGHFVNNILNNGAVNGVNAGGLTFQFVDGVITGNGSVNQTGSGITVLTNTNTYTGATTVTDGILRVGDGINGTINSSSGATVTGSGRLQIDQADTTVFTPTVFLNGADTRINTNTGAGKTVTVQGLISGTGSLQQNGAGTTVLTAANSYTGETQVTNGTLQVGNGISGSINASSGVRVFSLGDVLAINMANGATFTPGVDLSLVGTEVIGLVGFGNTNTVSGAIIGAGGVTQTGAGRTILTGPNAYTGPTTVNAGILQVGDGATGSIAAASAVNVALGSILAVNLAGGGTFGNSVTNAGNVIAIATGINTFSGSTSGAGNFNQNGVGGRSILTGANSYTGGTNVNFGTLQVGDGATGSINGTSVVTTAVGATLEVNLANNGSFGNAVTNNGAVNSNSANTNTLSGNINGTGTFAKNGGGKTITQGTNTYNGATTVAAGTLQVDGLLTSSNVTVQSGATLGGTGTIGQIVTILDGGHLAPGQSPGTITVGTLILNGASVSDYELNTPDIIGGGINDLTNVTGNLTLDGDLNIVDDPGPGSFGPGTYRLMNYGGTLTDNIMTVTTVPAGYNAADFLVTTNINNQVNLIVLGGPGAPVTQYWDGTNNLSNPSLPIGGNGTWENFNTNWTTVTGTPNSAWQNGIAVFGTIGGLVTLADDIRFKVLQFDVTGYTITGAGNTLVPTDAGTITVAGPLATVATVAAQIVDGFTPRPLAVRPASLIKNGAGTLELTNAANSYSGGTSINEGRLTVTQDSQLGTGNLTFNGDGELLTGGAGPFNTAKTVTIGATNTGRLSNSNGISLSTYTGQFTLNATSTLAIGSASNSGVVILAPGVAPVVDATSLVAVDFGTLSNGNALGFQAITAVAASTTVAAGAILNAAGFDSTVNNLQGAGTLTNNTATAATYTVNSGNFTGVINNGGSEVALTKETAGLLVLGGQNIYSGDTRVNLGTLKAGSGVVFDLAGVAVSGAFAPASDFFVTGTLDLGGFSNSIGGLSGIVGGIVQNSGPNSATLFTGSNNGDTTFAGLIRDGDGLGGGSSLDLVKVGTGRQTLTGNNTYTGNTFLREGSLFADVDPGASTNRAFGTGQLVISGGTTLGSTVDNQTIANNIAVLGSFTIEADTHLNFPGNVDLNGGIPTINGKTASAEIKFTGVISNGGVTFSSPVNYTAFIIGNGQAVPFGDVANTYTGLTTVNDNVFLVLNKSIFAQIDGAIRGNVVQNGTGSLDYFQPDQIADTSSVTINGPGNFLGAELYAGMQLNGHNETIGALFGPSAGRVQLGKGILTVGAGNFAGVIADGAVTGAGVGGQLTKNTPGTLVLTGSNTYTGNTNINNGLLVLDGSVQSPTVAINFAGTLMGTGFAARNVTNSGVFSPGRSTGTFNIGGNYSQSAAGTMVIEIAGKNAGQHDLVAVGGQAALNGNLRLVDVKGTRLKVGDKITFLTAAGGVVGEFADVDNPFATANSIVTTDVIYEANAVSLAAVQGSFAEFADLEGLTPNQKSVAHALDKIAFNKKQAKLISFLNDQPLSSLPHDFDLIAAEELQSLYTIGISQANVQTANLMRRMDDIRAGTAGFSAAGLAVSGMMPQYSGSYLAPHSGLAGPEGKEGKEIQESPTPSKEIRPPAERRYGVFFTGTGEWTHVGTTENASGYDLASGGFTLGLDYRINEHFAVGINAGYARSSAELFGNGRVTVDGAKFGVYATYFNEGFYVDGALQGGFNSYDTRRSALRGSASGSTSGGEFNALLATGYDFKSNGFTYGPLASLQYTSIGFDSFGERGSLAPLNYQSQSGESFRTALGMKASYEWHVAGIIVKPEIRAAWQHEYGDSAFGIDSVFANGGSTFTVAGAEIGRDSLLLGVGFAVLWNERTSTYVYYDGELARSNYSSNNVSGGVRLEF